MRPSLEEFLKGSTRWSEKVDDCLNIRVNFHGYSEGYQREDGSWREDHLGTWCWYLLVPQQMYAHRWTDFVASRSEYGYYNSDSLPAFD